MSKITTFVDALMSGHALISDYEDWVQRWHSADNADPIAAMELHEYLGLSFAEYSTVITNPANIKFIVESRKYPGSVSAGQFAPDYALAARSKDASAVENLIAELHQR